MPAPARAALRPKNASARALALVLALACAVAGAALVRAYPLGPGPAAALVLLAAGAGWARTGLALGLPLALLPVAGLAPWTGWIVAEEFDLVLLAALAGGYAAWATGRTGAAASGHGHRPRGWAPAVVPGLLVVWAVGLWRGLDDAGGLGWDWWQGYREPLNSLRLAKPMLGALLWWALWRMLQRRDPAAAGRALAAGASVGLALAGLAVLWERAAFPGLLDFSSDYRTTALFWEMHVGGAALDAFIAATLPLALHQALAARRRGTQALALAGLALASYVALTTFSRIVYLAVPVGLALMLVARVRAPAWRAPSLRAMGAAAVAAVAAFALGAWWLFPGSGYRGLLVWWGCWAALLPLACAAPTLAPQAWRGGVALGLVAACVVVGAGLVLPKGPYLAYALAAAVTLALGWRAAQAHAPWVVAGSVACWGGAAAVAWHWGAQAGLRGAALALPVLPLALVLAARARRSAWPVDARALALLLVVMAAAGGVVAVFAGGAYMSGRVASSGGDLDDRGAHWQRSLDLLHTDAQRALGLGLGRYAEHYALEAGRDRPGDYRLVHDADGAHLVLVAGTHVQGWGEMLRLSQRLPVPPGVARVRLRARAAAPAVLHVDLCRKHLLYDAGCQVGTLPVPASHGQWQPLQLTLQGRPLAREGLPVFAVFSLGSETPALRVEVDDIELLDGNDRPLLRNGGFEQGLAGWLFSSDRFHMPWHAKNMAVHLWVETGLVGLVVVAGAALLALGRLLFGPGRGHGLAPALAAALAGMLIVGSVDSLFDMPRLAWLYLAWLLVALDLSPPRVPEPAPQRVPH